MNQFLKYSFKFLIIFVFTISGLYLSYAKPFVPKNYEIPNTDTPDNKQQKQNPNLVFPIEDRIGDKFNSDQPTQFDLRDPKNINTEVEYDPSLKQYSITEKIGNEYYRAPSYMTFEEFLKYQAAKDEEAYFKKRANSLMQISKKGGSVIPKVNLGNAIFDRIFGGNTIEVKPQGNVELFFGGNWQNVKNPTLVQRAQKYGIFDFDMNMNVNLLAKVGEKMRFNFNYNTKATFDFENQLKLNYTGQDDDIIKKIEAGYISFPLRTSLIHGVQSLFGIKTQLQFGRLMVNAVASQQKSKKESFSLKGGVQTQNFSISCDGYDEFRHFLLAQTFRKNFNTALKDFPVIHSLNNINRIEVWVTNKTGAVENARDVVAFQDLGEPEPYNNNFFKASSAVADNNANTLYTQLIQNNGTRNIGNVVSSLQGMGMKGRVDFEKTFARKLNPSEFTFNPQLGFVSINTQLQPDDVVGVAFQYTNNGKVYQVGEFAQDLPPDSISPKVLFLKMLKSTAPDPKVPLWNLMMKNIYSLGATNINKQDFVLNVMYLDPGGGEKRYLPEGPQAGVPLLTVLNLDRLNSQNDPQPDGRFDFVEGTTINPQTGKIMFPILEPFGEDLKPALGGNPQLEKKYLYNLLYDSTKNIAIQFPQYNRFLIKGSYKSANGSEIFLGGFNIPPGSVSVYAGGQKLTENIDYTVDYGIGKLKIINAGVLSSGIPINVSFENNAVFGTQIQNFVGTRLDYFINDKFTIGGTMLRLSERPYFQKVTYGDDPIKNTVLGMDVNYQSDMPSITRFLDKLPLISTTTPSMINALGEVATLIPGHNKMINDASGNGNIYIDDFEGTKSGFDLRFPVTSWAIASAPQEATDKYGAVLFPEATLTNNLNYGKNRARISWYNLDPCLVDPSQNCMPEHLKGDTAQRANHYIRLVQQQDVFPLKSYTTLQGNLPTFDLAFYPKERGPYNFDATNITVDGSLLTPSKRWGGIMRAIDYSDFETSNVEFIEFWLMDPFIKNPSNPGGSFYINLGNISEDILKDSRKFFENGLPYPQDNSKVTMTNWSKVPNFQQQITPAFDNDPSARAAQDVGYDGLNNEEEVAQFQSFIDELSANFGNTSQAYLNALKDPANDDFHHFRGDDYDSEKTPILKRYRRYNNSQGNSPVTDNNAQYSNAFTNIPESEDLNRDNTLNENEQYFQYRIDMKPNMEVGTNFIVNKQVTAVKLANGVTENETWYQFKVPIREYSDKIGGIADFKSIRFMRMFLTGFQDSVIMRFARLELGRNQWRKYNFSLRNPGELVPNNDNNATLFNLYSVSVEENSSRTPIPYVMPPGIQRQQQQVSNGQSIQQNEQSLSIQVCGLEDGDSRGVFKSLGMDMRQFKSIKMFVHAENSETAPLKKGDLRAFIRLGSDFVSNYYEYQIPLTFTDWGARDPLLIWPEANEFDIQIEDLVNVKMKRNKSGVNYALPFYTKDAKGNYIKIVGNPNIGEAKMAMLGILNPQKTPDDPTDDGAKKCAEVWFDELRLSNMNEQGGSAAMGRVEVQLADIGNIKLSGNTHTAGYGNIDQKINQRYRDNYSQFDVSANINAGKFAPKSWGVQLPIYAGYSQTVSNPIYDPYDLDIKLKDKVKEYSGKKKDSLKSIAQDFTSIKSINIQNVRISPTKNKKVKLPWDIQNFDLSYSFTQTNKHNPLIEKDKLDEHSGTLGYAYNIKSAAIEPFKKLISPKKKYFQLIRDFNIGLLPSSFSMRNTLNRTMGETKVRNIDDGNYPIQPSFYKFFTWNRAYNLRWDLTKSLSLDYHATNNARIDEPYGYLDSQEKKDTLWNNMKRLGRTTAYNQGLNASYNVPLNKFPLLDWTTLRASYGTTFNWNAASLLAKSLGNVEGNTQNRQVNGELNFTQLYNKVKLLKVINSPNVPANSPKGKNIIPEKRTLGGGSKGIENIPGNDRQKDIEKFKELVKNGSGQDKGDNKNPNEKENKKEDHDNTNKTDVINANPGAAIENVKSQDLARRDSIAKAKLKEKEQKKNEELAKKALKKKNGPNPSEGVRMIGKILMMTKRASFSYTENMGTTLPGYMDSTQFVGVNFRNSTGSGLPFAFGYQPDRYWLEGKGRDNVMTRDSLFNAPFQQQYSQTFNATLNLEPIKDFKVDLLWNKTFNKGYTEIFKDTIGGNGYVHLNPYETGGFSISYIAIKSMFDKYSSENGTRAFNDFSNNRKVISERLGIVNPYTAGVRDPNDPEFYKGYTRYSQDVIIPAFLAAYTRKDPKTFPLVNTSNENIRSNPFKNILPLPNWRINYNGLARTKFFKNIFQNFTLNHAYTGTLGMNSFTSALLYRDVYSLGFPSFIDSVSNNYVPYFMVPNMTISENFSPLIGVDATFKNSLNFRVEYKKSRTLSMSLIDFQLSETKSKEISLGGGYRLKNITINTPYFGLNKYKSDVNIKLDVSLRDDLTTLNRLDQKIHQPTRGQKVIGISPSIDYLLTQSVTLRFFMDRRQSIPYVSNAFPITTTRGGVMIRFMLGQ